MKRNPINQYNLRSNSKQTNTPSSSLDDAHWNDDIDDDDNIEFRTNIDDDIYNDANISANMTEVNTPKPFDPDLEHLIITILYGKKYHIRQALNNGAIYSWEDFTLFNPDNTEYLTYKDGNENRELPFLTQKKIKYAIFYYKWLKQDNDPKADFPRLWIRDKFIEWWHGPATRYIAANAAMKFQQSKDNNNLSNWKTRGSPTKLNSRDAVPSTSPSDVPSTSPSESSSDVPSTSPSDVPPTKPSDVPSNHLSAVLSKSPSDVASTSPSDVPPTKPSDVPSNHPSAVLSKSPSDVSSTSPSDVEPSDVPSTSPSDAKPSDVPSTSPSDAKPSDVPPTRPSDAPPWTPFCVYFRDSGEHSNPVVPKELFISCNPEFRQSWSRLDEKTRISNLHCKAGTGKKNHELQVQHHKLQVRQDRFYDASDTSGKKIPRSGCSNLPTQSSLHPGHHARMLSKSKIRMQHFGNLVCDSAINVGDLDNPQYKCTTPSFVYFRDDGEHIDSDGPTAPPWTQFEVTLKDENGNPRLYSKGDPITVIAPPPSELQGRVFLTKPEEHGDIKHARVVEIMKWAVANDLEHKQLLEYKFFSDKGQFIESNILNGYQQIRTFDVNLMHDVLSGKAVTGIYSTVPSISSKQTHAHIPCSVPSISGKQTHAHISYDCTTKITDAYRACLQDRVRTRGAPNYLIDDEFPRWGVLSEFRSKEFPLSMMGSFTTLWRFFHNVLNHDFHDREFYQECKIDDEFPRWGVLSEFRSKEFPLSMMGSFTTLWRFSTMF
jgi:hypothetical protein